jgi:hypothetical protein
MFICDECAKKALSKQGKEWPFPESYGPCELCDEIANCKDVTSGWDWAWASTAKKGAK